MAITVSTPTGYEAPFRLGDFVAQMEQVSALSGATTGTITAPSIVELAHIILPAGFRRTAADSISGSTATLAFTVPAETASSRLIDGITYTATANQGLGGNSITIQEVDGTGDLVPVTKGNETVFVTGTAIVVHIDPTAITGSARTDVRVAVNANAAAALLVTATGTDVTVASVTAATALQSGVTGGAAGLALCLGRI